MGIIERVRRIAGTSSSCCAWDFVGRGLVGSGTAPVFNATARPRKKLVNPGKKHPHFVDA